MSTENTVGMSYVQVDNVKWEAPTPVVKEIERLTAELKQANAALRSLRGSAMGQDDGWIIDAVDEALSALETGDD